MSPDNTSSQGGHMPYATGKNPLSLILIQNSYLVRLIDWYMER
jgi:hypothetical protein